MEENAYQLLGLEQGPAATEAEIKKAYRKLALVKHPDKNPDNPRAADEFQALQKAYELLTDKGARAALDALVRAKAARAERTAVHDEKRRRMMADLERREAEGQAGRSQEEQARAKLKGELERLRRQAAERAAQKAAEQAAAAAATQEQQGAADAAPAQQQQQQDGGGGAAAGAPGQVSEALRERLTRTLKVSWSRKGGEYGAAQLRQIFAARGAVEDVVLRDGKKRKGSALVVMADAAAAATAAAAVNGPLSNPLLVLPFNKATGSAVDEAAGGGGRSVSPAAARMPAATAAPVFAAATAAATRLGPQPAAPLFAAGARAGTSATAQQPASSLFPGGAAAGARPLFAAGTGPGARPAFAAAAAQPAAAGGGGAAAFPGSFSSFAAAGGPAGSGVHALSGGLEDSTLAKMRQAAERRRLIEELEREQQQAGQGGAS